MCYNKGGIKGFFLYFVTFSMMKPPLDMFSQDLKILRSIIVIFRVLTKLFLTIFSQDLSKIQNFVNKDYVLLQGFWGQSPTVR